MKEQSPEVDQEQDYLSPLPKTSFIEPSDEINYWCSMIRHKDYIEQTLYAITKSIDQTGVNRVE